MKMKTRRTKFQIINIMLNKLKRRKNSGIYKIRLKQEVNLSPMGFKEYINKLIETKGR